MHATSFIHVARGTRTFRALARSRCVWVSSGRSMGLLHARWPPLPSPQHYAHSLYVRPSLASLCTGLPHSSGGLCWPLAWHCSSATRARTSYPLNFFGLAFLTAVMSLDVGVMAAVASAMGMGALVAQAAIITALLVTGLTIYTFRSKRDFSFLGAALWPLTFGLFAFGLLSCFFPSLHTGILGLIVSFAGAAIFCAYLVYDTWRIANELEVDDYVEGAIQLYMDIINLFMYILDILMQLNKGGNSD